MTFNDEYKNQIESIKADSYIKQRVLSKLEKKEVKKKTVPFKALATAAVCLLLAAVLAIPNFTDYFKGSISGEKETVSEDYIAKEEQNKALKNLSYNEIYEKVKEIADFSDAEMELYAEGDTGIAVGDDVATSSSAANGTTKPSSSNKNSATKNDGIADYSETTAQVEGVTESDVVKTDGKYIYALSQRDAKIRIVKAGKTPEKKAEINLLNPYKGQSIYVNGNRLVVFGSDYSEDIQQENKESYSKYDMRAAPKTTAYIYDISNPEEPKMLIKCQQSGNFEDSRLIGDKLYIISNYLINTNDIDQAKPESYVPTVECKDYNGAMEADCVYVSEVCKEARYTVICGYDITDGSLMGSQSVLGGTYALYCSTNNIITAGYSNNNKTAITRYEINDGKITLKAEGSIKGSLLNQFSIDEYKGNFRFVTTYSYGEEGESAASGASGTVYYRIYQANMLTVLNGNLKQIGSIEKIAPDEQIYSVRFMGDMAYFVTFRQVDPLFSVDLSNPQKPKIVGSLKIPGFSNYLFPYGENLLLGIGQDADENTGASRGVKLSMFDIKNPADVRETAKEILDINSSDALFSHKNAMILPEKNIIGFDAWDNTRAYMIYSFENRKFVKRAQVDLGTTGLYAKGLYIGNEIYIVTTDSITVLDINSFDKVGEISFK